MHFLILIFFSFYDNKQCADDECAGLGERERPPYPVDTAEKSRQKQHCGNLENEGSQKRDRRGDRTVRQSGKKRWSENIESGKHERKREYIKRVLRDS